MRCVAPLLLLLLAHCPGGVAQDAQFRAAADAEIARRPARYSNSEARAWSIRRDGQERGQLWGTMHVTYGDDTVLPPPVRARFYQAADLSVETALTKADLASIVQKAAQLRAPAETANPAALHRLDPAVRKALDDHVSAWQQRRLSLLGMAATLTRGNAGEGAADTPQVGFVDINLISFARKLSHPVLRLEQIDLSLLDSGDSNRPVAAATLALKPRQSDTADLEHLKRAETGMLTTRNANWLPVLERTLETPGTHSIAVRGAHLIGQDGLVALPRARGYTVTACPSDICT